MDIFLWMLFGAITAWIVSIMAGATNQQKIVASIVLGIFGAVMAGFVMQIFTGQVDGGLNYYSLLVAVAGSLVIAAIFARKKV